MADFNRETDAALRSAFIQLGVRIAPEAKTSAMVEQLKTHGVDVEVDSGMVCMKQNGVVASTGTVLRSFAIEHKEHFILPGGQVRSAADLRPAGTPEGIKQRTELINKLGLDAFREIISAP